MRRTEKQESGKEKMKKECCEDEKVIDCRRMGRFGDKMKM